MATPDTILAQPLDILGIKEQTAILLRDSGIKTVFDLLLRVPKSVVEQEESPGFLYLEAGRRYVVMGTVIAKKITGVHKRKRLEAVLQDETGRLHVVFFGPAVTYAQKYFQEDKEVTIAGEAKKFLGRFQMVHPKLVTATSAEPPQAISTYAQIAGITSPMFQKILQKALIHIKDIEHVPEQLLKARHMSSLKEALFAIHKPKNAADNEWDNRKQSPYYRRLAFEELIRFFVRINKEQKNHKKLKGPVIQTQSLEELVDNFLPFTLTLAQQRVVNEIIADMKKPDAMTRLVQGDVGSGKTAVSALVARLMAQNGYQAAVMAPTEILAEQLYHTYHNFFSGIGIKIGLLTANTKTKERALMLQDMADGSLRIVVGTHALLSDGVLFKNLGLVIIDEQHRFGVNQRAELLRLAAQSQSFTPHLLVMSATPIPRSLALTLYGDLDLSVIDERPKGRIPIHTQMLMGPVIDSLKRVAERIKATGQKAFVVFPLIEESEHLDLEHASKAAGILKEQFGVDSTMLLHGKMKPDEKALAMAKFRDNHITFLVATTVVEVGIDIPDATCMVIMHPERFGLSQLHQLRGRVGRGSKKSFCFLVTDVKNRFGTAYKRLDALCKTDDGFKLAEVDLEIRGPGELWGTKQSGLPNFLIFNHLDFADLVSTAKEYAKTIVKSDFHSKAEHLFPLHQEHGFS